MPTNCPPLLILPIKWLAALFICISPSILSLPVLLVFYELKFMTPRPSITNM